MEWYVLRTVSGKEDDAVTILRKRIYGVELIYPRKRISWRKQGSIISLVKPLFAGYLFVSYPREKIADFEQLLHRYKLNMVDLVYSAGALVPIFSEEKQLIQQLLGPDGIVEESIVEKCDDQLQVVSGPLVGLEHIVKKVSRRNRRIAVEIPMLNERRTIELEGILT